MKENSILKTNHDVSLHISVANGRYSTDWKNKIIPWSKLVSKLSESRQTSETYNEYVNYPKSRQDSIKDIGGFVGGHIKNGRRKNGNIEDRQIITLDADAAKESMWADIQSNFDLDIAMLIYSTHKHKEGNPRYRVIIPLDRAVSPDEYEAIARKIAEKIGMEYFDPTTFQASRLMYWPSHPRDVSPVFEYNDSNILKADDVLAEYNGHWMDVSYWPTVPGYDDKIKKTAQKQQDPTEKSNWIGAFCRTYGIKDAIATFIPDVYEACTSSDRYSYSLGSTSGGAVVYDDKFIYSNHATDPISGQLCNAFDMVRVHKFGYLDYETEPDTPAAKMPSYKEMLEFSRNDAGVKKQIAAEKQAEARADFADDYEDPDAWKTMLEYKKKSQVLEPSLKNLMLIIQHDRNLKGIVFNQLADSMEITDEVPWKHHSKFWRDADDSQLICYVNDFYGEFPKSKFDIAVSKIVDDRAYHPIKKYFENLPEWDGFPRVDTLIVDYLGAKNCEYVRQATRKILCAAYKRIYAPGIKFDNILVLNGGQGIGKSTLLSKLGGEWYSDSLSLSDTQDKTAAEKLQGYWIIEIGELAGMRKADIDKVKAFISSQNDRYRASFGRRVTPHPRQCVFFGTTNNDDGYLRDITGNRRFWNINVTGKGALKPWDITQDDIEQIWAEVKVLVEAGEDLFLRADVESEAEKAQRDAMESDDREGLVAKYLDTLLTENWDSLDIHKRREIIHGADESMLPEGTVQRQKVSNIEIWCECFKKDAQSITKKDSYDIAAIMKKIPGWKRCSKPERISLYGVQRVYERL